MFFFQLWENHETMFPNVGLLAHQILGIIGSQIEIERVFSLPWIFTNLKESCSQSNNLGNLIFVSKNWPKHLPIWWR